MWVLAVLLVAIASMALVSGFLLYRAARRLLQFDEVFQGLIPLLDEYSGDLVRMTSADLDGIMVDHPEVLSFHRRNMRARRDIQLVIDSITSISPRPPRRSDPKLPLPDME